MDEREAEKIRKLDVEFESKEAAISEGYKFEGFAELRSYKVSEVTEEIGDSSFKKKYVIFEALVHGRESAIVCVREDSDLYYFMLNITDSESLSQLSGKYLPVDKVSDGMYQPSESLFNDFESLDVKGDKFEKVKRGIKWGHVEYSIEDKWELTNPEGYKSLYNRLGTSIRFAILFTFGTLSVILMFSNNYTLLIIAIPFLLVIFSYINYKGFNYIPDVLPFIKRRNVP